jgi:hypothetical protein
VTTAYTSLLGLALPVTGELAGTWGDTVNASITQLVEDSVAGVSTFDVTSGNWTLSTTTNGLPNEARTAILIPTGTPGVSRNVIAPSHSKAYILINQSNAAVVLKGSATTGVTIPAGSTFLCAWNGSDFVKVSENVAGSNTQIQFNNNGVFGASSSLTWDGSTLAVTGAVTATTDSAFTSTGALKISAGTTAQRPGSPSVSMIRYNSTTGEFEGYSGSSPAWKSIGGSALSNDTSTSSYVYPTFAGATTGTALNLYTSNAKLLYKPSTGEFKAAALIAGNGIMLNTDTVSSNYEITTGTNGFSIGPISIDSGATVTITSGQRWVII